ncbi:MAG: glutathione S-transferase family protein [SAR324 cluster bacterium]|nr:glutathione S-transferase family protein [SAR324 cluster bacterium]
MLTFFYNLTSPYSRKVRIVLAELEIPHEGKIEDPPNPTPEFQAVNPNWRIPAIVDGKVQLFESNLILEYLLKTYPGQSKETPPFAKGFVRSDHRWDDAATLVAIETMLNSGINLLQLQRNDIGPEQSSYLRREADRIQRDLDWLEKRATPEGFAPGEFSILDVNLICTLEWGEFREIFAWRDRPNLSAIVARYQERESVRTTKPA